MADAQSLATLRATAEAATPGPWHDVRSMAYVSRSSQGRDDRVGSVRIAQCGDMRDTELKPFNASRWRADAAHIAAWHPTAALALLARLDRAEAALSLAANRMERLALEVAGRRQYIEAIEWVEEARAYFAATEEDRTHG